MSARAAREVWPAAGAAVPAARHLVRSHLRTHGLAALADNAELIVSELVGNVVVGELRQFLLDRRQPQTALLAEFDRLEAE